MTLCGKKGKWMEAVMSLEEGEAIRARFLVFLLFFFSSRRRHTRFDCDWSSDVCSSDLGDAMPFAQLGYRFGGSRIGDVDGSGTWQAGQFVTAGVADASLVACQVAGSGGLRAQVTGALGRRGQVPLGGCHRFPRGTDLLSPVGDLRGL